MLASYDRDMRSKYAARYYGHSDFYNFGYWEPETKDQWQASETLMAKLIELIPRKEGKILDVAWALEPQQRGCWLTIHQRISLQSTCQRLNWQEPVKMLPECNASAWMQPSCSSRMSLSTTSSV
jgi:hypothetical protein